MKQEDYFI